MLARLSRTIRRERDRLRTKVRSIALRLSSAIARERTVLAAAIESKEDIKVLSEQAENVESKIYGEVEKKIAAAREKEEGAIASSNKWVRELAAIRQGFEQILLVINRLGDKA